VKTIMAGMGHAVMGTGISKGDRRASDAAMCAIASPLLEEGAIDGARGILINITGSSSMKLSEVIEASTIIQNAAHEDANIIFGAVQDERMKDEMKITVIATGFKASAANKLPVLMAASGGGAPITVNTSSAPAREPAVPSFVPNKPMSAPRVTGSVSSISVGSQSTVSTQAQMAARASAPMATSNVTQRESPTLQNLKQNIVKNVDVADDDLDVPAFIRKKTE